VHWSECHLRSRPDLNGVEIHLFIPYKNWENLWASNGVSSRSTFTMAILGVSAQGLGLSRRGYVIAFILRFGWTSFFVAFLSVNFSVRESPQEPWYLIVLIVHTTFFLQIFQPNAIDIITSFLDPDYFELDAWRSQCKPSMPLTRSPTHTRKKTNIRRTWQMYHIEALVQIREATNELANQPSSNIGTYYWPFLHHLSMHSKTKSK
jgi:hypothetical protein